MNEVNRLKKQIIINEDWVKMENDLAEELLNTNRENRYNKYTEIYEKSYSIHSPEERSEMSNDYLESAISHNFILRKIIGTGKSVLDIGCGFGHESALLAKQGNHVTGIDINRIHICEAKKVYGHLNDLQFLPTKGVKLDFPNNSFEYVFSKSVFEHLHPDDVNDHLSEVKRVLKPQSEYIFTAITPYDRGDISAFSKDPEQRKKTGFHINILTWEKLRKVLNDNGYTAKTNILPHRIADKIPYFSFLINISFKVWLEKKIKMTPFQVRLFKMGGVFIRAQLN